MGGVELADPDETVAARILDLLGGCGVRTAFGLPGVHNLPFWRASPRPGRPSILAVRHEQTAGYAADGLARATGGLGVALTTTGPGAANAIAAFGEAWSVHSPVLLIASEAPLRVRRPGVGHGALHEMPDQSALFAPLAKAVFTASDPDEAVAMAADAITVARSAPAGPVYLGIPADVLGATANVGPAVVAVAFRVSEKRIEPVADTHRARRTWCAVRAAAKAAAGQVVAGTSVHRSCRTDLRLDPA